jgi:nucleoside 2-deoxyribosyltransferase
MKIYFAGPLFTYGERAQNKAIVECLRALGHVVFLPQETEQKEGTAASIFKGDMDGLDWSEITVGCMDNPDPDSGTCFEVGYTYGKKPIILYRTDIRQEAAPLGPYNLMLTQAADAVLNLQWHAPAAIALAIHEAIIALPQPWQLLPRDNWLEPRVKA